jgi:hypothetical protein
VSVWGFKESERVVYFEMWATSSGIDWNVPPDEQPLGTATGAAGDCRPRRTIAAHQIEPGA